MGIEFHSMALNRQISRLFESGFKGLEGEFSQKRMIISGTEEGIDLSIDQSVDIVICWFVESLSGKESTGFLSHLSDFCR
jgi:hypothetical protein